MRSSGGNLYAIAHRGACDVAPSSRCCVASIDLDHRAVDLPVDGVPVLLPVRRGTPRPSAIESPPLGGRRHRQAGLGRPLQEPHVRIERHALRRAERVHPQAQRPRRGHLRVLLAQRAGRGVARVGERPSARPPSSRSFSSSNAFTGRYISPRISTTAGGSSSASRAGTPPTVRTLAVMSSPVTPVAARGRRAPARPARR